MIQPQMAMRNGAHSYRIVWDELACRVKVEILLVFYKEVAIPTTYARLYYHRITSENCYEENSNGHANTSNPLLDT